MEFYTNKRAYPKAGQLAKCPYIPNQLIYIAESNGSEIVFYGFFKDKGEAAISPKKHSFKKAHYTPKDFQTIPKNITVVPQIIEMINGINSAQKTLF